MRHKVSGRKLNSTASHRDAMFSNMATSILEKERITTTLTKAKEVRSVVERLITYGKKGDLHGIRLAARRINNKTVLKKLVEDIAPGYKDREGGYTRIIKIGERKGDNAPMSIIELVGRGNPDAVRKKTKKKAKTKRTPNKVETPKAVVTEEPTQPEVAAEEQEIKDEGVTEQEKKEQQEGSENKAQEEEK